MTEQEKQYVKELEEKYAYLSRIMDILFPLVRYTAGCCKMRNKMKKPDADGKYPYRYYIYGFPVPYEDWKLVKDYLGDNIDEVPTFDPNL